MHITSHITRIHRQLCVCVCIAYHFVYSHVRILIKNKKSDYCVCNENHFFIFSNKKYSPSRERTSTWTEKHSCYLAILLPNCISLAHRLYWHPFFVQSSLSLSLSLCLANQHADHVPTITANPTLIALTNSGPPFTLSTRRRRRRATPSVCCNTTVCIY
jgi:hypothetical protein